MPLRPATSAKRRCDLRSSLAGGLFLPRTTARGDAQQLWLGLLKIADLDPGQLGAATGAGEAEQQQCPVAQPRQVSPIGAKMSRKMPIFAASFGLGPWPAGRARPRSRSPSPWWWGRGGRPDSADRRRPRAAAAVCWG
jgi:hypothetical protein